MDGTTLLIVIGLTYWLTARHYKKKFNIKTIQVIEKPEESEPESLAKETYRKRKVKVEEFVGE